MKNFTRLFSLATLALFSSVAFAQTDLSVTGLQTIATATGEISPESPTILILQFENSGVDVIPDQATALVWFLNGTDTIQTINGVFNGAIAPGDAVTASSDPFTLPPTPANINLCAGILMTSVGETDSTNNNICLPFTVSTSAQTDLKANAVSIVAPTDIDGFNIDNGDNTVPEITEMSAIFENAGNVIYPEGYSISYRIALNGDTINVTGRLGEDLTPASTTTRQITNAAIIPTVPQDSGTYDLCVIANEGDENPANDIACTSFTIVDQFDVSNPDNWPLGLEDRTEEGVQVFARNGVINIAGIKDATTVQVTDMQGRMVATRVINENSTFNIQNASGVYIVTTTDAVNNVVTTKVVL